MSGLELRGCWEEGSRRATPLAAGEGDSGDRPYRQAPVVDPRAWQPATPARTFVPVGEVSSRRAKRGSADARGSDASGKIGGAPRPAHDDTVPADPPLIVDPGEPWEQRTSLFGEVER